MQPYDEEWKQAWNSTIGGSRAPAILGVSRFKTALDVYREMFGGYPLPDLEASPDIRRGRALESVAREELEKRTGLLVRSHNQCEFVTCADYPFAHCLPDGWTSLMHPVELKVPRPHVWRRNYLEGLSPEYIVQAQHTMAVTDTDVCHVALLDPVSIDLLHVNVQRDNGFIEQMMEREAEFWENGKRGVEPACDAAIEDMPKVEGALVTLAGEDAAAAAQLYRDGKELADEAAQIVESAKARLLKMASDARACTIVKDGTEVARFYNSLCQGRETVDKKALLAAFPGAAQFYKRGAAYNTFKFYWRGGGQDE